MGSGTLFNGSAIKLLKNILRFKDNTEISSTTISRVLDTSHVPTTTDFPNSTNLYGWNIDGSSDYDDGDWIGSKALTENGALTSILSDASVNDLLGNDTFCYFDGTNDYLSSTDAVFNMTGSFSICGWFYSADWTPATSEVLISRSNGTNGWVFQLLTTGAIGFYNRTAAAYEVYAYPNDLPSGWHHVAFVRNSGTASYIYIDGLCLGSSEDAAAITAAGNFQVGADNGLSSPFTGGIQYVAIDTDTAWTANEVRKIYSAQCQSMAFQSDSNVGAKVSIYDGRAMTGYTKSIITSSYSITDSYTDCGLECFAWEDGLYEIDADFTISSSDTTSAAASPRVQLANGGTGIDSTPQMIYTSLSGDPSDYANIPVHLKHIGYLQKGDKITVQADAVVGTDTCTVYYSNGTGEPALRLKKLD